MKGIKKHTHSDRAKIIKKIAPLIVKKFGDNFIALAGCCSFARNEDVDYSDLELVAFVKSMPEGKPQGGMAKIYEGMLIELMWMTREAYLKDTRDVTEHWHYSGSDRLIAIINDDFIAEVNGYQPPDIEQQCLDRAVGCFSEVQEAVSKVLNAVNQKNHEGIPILFFYMVLEMLKVLSFLNQEPYVTASRMFAQAKKFDMKPASFDRLLYMAEEGRYSDLSSLRRLTVDVFEEFESIFEKLGIELYDDNFDPNKPVHRMRQFE